MKKFLSVLLCICLILNLCILSFASEYVVEHYDEVSCGIVIDGKMTCIIRNEYFSIYADNYFECQFEEFNTSYDVWKTDRIEYIGDVRMERSSDGTVKAVKMYADKIRENDDIWYSTVIFDYQSDFSAERNMAIASSLCDGIEVLYTGNSTPCAVVAVRGGTDVIDKIIENEKVSFVESAFSTVNGTVVTDDIIDIRYQPKASDARKILRYAAGLDGLPEARSQAKKFLVLSDTDLDGKITASDARTALRISAGLERGHSYFHYTGSSWYY